MADLYKFRVSIDLEVATHDEPRNVRDFLVTYLEEAIAPLRRDGRDPILTTGIIDQVTRLHVRAKRLADAALIGPEVSLICVDPLKCPHCASVFTDVVIEKVPYVCPACRYVIPLVGQIVPVPQ